MTFDTTWGMQVKISFRYYVQKHRDTGLLRRGTQCHLTFLDKANHMMHGIYAAATCDTRQQFVKEKGRCASLAKALVEMGATRSQRAEVWYNYHARSQRSMPKAIEGAHRFSQHAKRRFDPLGFMEPGPGGVIQPFARALPC